jgi:hypothetical protein
MSGKGRTRISENYRLKTMHNREDYSMLTSNRYIGIKAYHVSSEYGC